MVMEGVACLAIGCASVAVIRVEAATTVAREWDIDSGSVEADVCPGGRWYSCKLCFPTEPD